MQRVHRLLRGVMVGLLDLESVYPDLVLDVGFSAGMLKLTGTFAP
jgi:hypothetical protein